jgi:hypothetical protein
VMIPSFISSNFIHVGPNGAHSASRRTAHCSIVQVCQTGPTVHAITRQGYRSG